MKQNNFHIEQDHAAGRYYGIDIIKFLCAFLIVAIHISPFPEKFFQHADALNFFMDIIGRIAVPFYFTVSGFLLFCHLDEGPLDTERIRNYCFKLLRLLGLWTMLLIVGEKGHLWYLRGTVVAVICLSLCFYWHMKFDAIALLALMLYVVGLFGDAYYGFLEQLRAFAPVDYAVKGYEYFFGETRNGLFMGFPFLVIGASFAQKKIRMKTIHAAIGFVGSMTLLIAEVYLLEHHGICKDYNMFLSLLPAAFFLFALAISVKGRSDGKYEKLQTIGVLIYYMHVMVADFISLGFRLILKYAGYDLYPFLFPATVVFTLLAAILIQNLSQRKHFGWLQYLYR